MPWKRHRTHRNALCNRPLHATTFGAITDNKRNPSMQLPQRNRINDGL
jgi:hypothetical protein